MQQFLASPHQTCIVLEDDFEWAQSPETIIKQINTLFENKEDFDVCMLSVNPYDLIDTKEYPFLQKVNNGLTTSGYIVTPFLIQIAHFVGSYEWKRRPPLRI